MTMKILFATFAVICLGSSAASMVDQSSKTENRATAEETSFACMGCHNANFEGFEAARAPQLAGQNIAYLIEQMRYFRDNVRGYAPADVHGNTMRIASEALSDQEMRALARYIGSKKPITPKQNSARAMINRGKALYNSSCASCHGWKAQGNTHMRAPNLKILSGWYIKDQMSAYKRGWRGTHEKTAARSKFMRSISRQVTVERELDEIIAYIHSLRN